MSSALVDVVAEISMIIFLKPKSATWRSTSAGLLLGFLGAAFLLTSTAAPAGATPVTKLNKGVSLRTAFTAKGWVIARGTVTERVPARFQNWRRWRVRLEQRVVRKGPGRTRGKRVFWRTRDISRAVGARKRFFRLRWRAPRRFTRLVVRIRVLFGRHVVAVKIRKVRRKRVRGTGPGFGRSPAITPSLPSLSGPTDTPDTAQPPPSSGGDAAEPGDGDDEPNDSDTGTALPGKDTTVSTGDVTLFVPAGTVDAPATASVTPMPDGEPELGGYGADIHIDADWQNGSKSVRITMPLPADTGPSLEPMVVHDHPDGRRELLMGDRLAIDEHAGTVTFETTSLSRFWSVTLPSSLKLVSGGPAIYDIDVARALYDELVGLSADQPSCDPDITHSASIASSGSAFSRSGINAAPAIRHCVSFRSASGGQPNRGRWVLANNTGAVLRVLVDEDATVVNFGTAKDMLTDVAFLALNGASTATIEAGATASDSVYGPEVYVPPGASVAITVPDGAEGTVDLTASAALLPHAFVLRQLGVLLGGRVEAIELLDHLNSCGYVLAISTLDGFVSCIRTVATDVGGQLGRLLKKTLFVVDAFTSTSSTLIHAVDPLAADLRYASANPPSLGDPRTERVDIAFDGGAPNQSADSWNVDISRNGCRVVFVSRATDLVEQPDPPGSLGDDVFVRDICADETFKATIPVRPQIVCAGSTRATKISGNGRYVVFSNCAENLAPLTDPESDLYVHDTWTKETRTIPDALNDYSVDISDDGRWIAHTGQLAANGHVQAFLFDRVTRTSQLISRSAEAPLARRSANVASISGDGRYVAYKSARDALEPEATSDPYGPLDTVYVYDRLLDTTEKVPPLDACAIPYDGSLPSHYSVDNARLTDSGREVLNTCARTVVLYDLASDDERVVDAGQPDSLFDTNIDRCELSYGSSWVGADITPDGQLAAFARSCVPAGVKWEDGSRENSRVVVRDLKTGEEDLIVPPAGCEGVSTAGLSPGALSASGSVVVHRGLFCGDDWPLMVAVR